MIVEEKVQAIINKVHAGGLNHFLEEVDGTDFGIYVPVYEDDGQVKMMLEGYSQIERDLEITITPDEADDDALPIGWFGQLAGKDSSCKHGSVDKCKHCTGHTAACRHCTHPNNSSSIGIDAPELDYQSTVSRVTDLEDTLKALAVEGLGITLLHGHNEQYMFTKLPENYISVIAGGKTSFRKESDVVKDQTFVPTVWRSINGDIRVAGGHSRLGDELIHTVE